MTRLYARTLLAIGLAGALFAGSRVAFIGLTQGASPVAEQYYTTPEGGPAHKRGCPYVDWERKDLIELPGLRSAEKVGLCDECTTAGRPTRTASTQSRSPARGETARAQIQPAAD